ncbi:MAG: hypothetical protein HY509_01140 [Acidobacteria bacterium]|nr:hypothetical protein [Acidobacteriota bacterium]
MTAINSGRIWLGTVVGGVVWTAWTMLVNIVFQRANYEAGQEAGILLAESRYAYFLPVWILTLFALTWLGSWTYARVRSSAGPGPATALKVGAVLGFAAGFPMNFSLASWLALSRVTMVWWMLDLWIGAILAVLVAGWFYKE